MGEDWERTCASAASQSAMEPGKRRVERRCSCVTCAAMEWSDNVFFVTFSGRRQARAQEGRQQVRRWRVRGPDSRIRAARSLRSFSRRSSYSMY